MTNRAPGTGTGTDAVVSLDVSLLGREYRVACKASERAELLDAVALLDRRMREIRDGGKVVGAERVAVMAALNLAHDLLRERDAASAAPSIATATGIDDRVLKRRIASMQSAIDQVLAAQEQSR
jgi:cell division protein ZapA